MNVWGIFFCLFCACNESLVFFKKGGDQIVLQLPFFLSNAICLCINDVAFYFYYNVINIQSWFQMYITVAQQSL